MKPLNLPKESQEALLNGASMFIVPLSNGQQDFEEYCINPIDIISKYQIGDEVYLQEEQSIEDDMIFNPYSESSELTESVIIYKGIITDIEIVKVQKVCGNDKASIMNKEDHLGYIEDIFEDWYNKQYGEGAYKRNDYVFLYTIEEIK